MSKPASNKTLLLIICVLLLTNIAVLAWVLWPRHGSGAADMQRNGSGASELLKSDVGFDAAQLAQYKTLKDRQKETVRPLFEDMRNSKDSLFRLLGDSLVTDSTLNNITDHIAAKQKSLDLLTFHHFSELRKICRPDQRVAYDSMVVRMFHRNGRTQTHRPEEKK